MDSSERSAHPGLTTFLTLSVPPSVRASRLLIENYGLLTWAMREVRRIGGVHVDAMVVLPDHLHAVWRLPDGDIQTRISLLEELFGLSAFVSDVRPLTGMLDYAESVRRCWFDPVSHGLTPRPEDWAYSSIHGASVFPAGFTIRTRHGQPSNLS